MTHAVSEWLIMETLGTFKSVKYSWTENQMFAGRQLQWSQLNVKPGYSETDLALACFHLEVFFFWIYKYFLQVIVIG
jgi:hypothetical protein